MKLNFSKFEGDELAMFIENIPVIKQFVETQLIPTTEITTFMKGLCLLPDLFEFMKLSYMPANPKEHEKNLEQFENNLKLFYQCGNTTFLRDGDEPFYFHWMCYYLPRIAKDTYAKHKLGLGIFNMQGFERWNKESKSLIQRFCMNNKKHP